jgi:hypothetical protein
VWQYEWSPRIIARINTVGSWLLPVEVVASCRDRIGVTSESRATCICVQSSQTRLRSLKFGTLVTYNLPICAYCGNSISEDYSTAVHVNQEHCDALFSSGTVLVFTFQRATDRQIQPITLQFTGALNQPEICYSKPIPQNTFSEQIYILC